VPCARRVFWSRRLSRAKTCRLYPGTRSHKSDRAVSQTTTQVKENPMAKARAEHLRVNRSSESVEW
jgi:hypothetical protein